MLYRSHSSKWYTECGCRWLSVATRKSSSLLSPELNLQREQGGCNVLVIADNSGYHFTPSVDIYNGRVVVDPFRKQRKPTERINYQGYHEQTT